MDCMAFGMGMCCLQVTFQARDIQESRYLYDQLAVLGPLLLALTAATPALRGRVVDTDTRWNIIQDSVDCRTPEERGCGGLGGVVEERLAASSSSARRAFPTLATARGARVAAAAGAAARRAWFGGLVERGHAAAEAGGLDAAGVRRQAGNKAGAAIRWLSDDECFAVLGASRDGDLVAVLAGAGTAGSEAQVPEIVAGRGLEGSGSAGGEAGASTSVVPLGEPSCSGGRCAAPAWADPETGAAHRSNAAGQGRRPIAKSRYSSVSSYLSQDPRNTESLSDLPLEIDDGALARLLEAGLDPRLARHVAHLFVRDPLVVFREKVELDDEQFVDHWESLQSTNWNSVRWKPPPPVVLPVHAMTQGGGGATAAAAAAAAVTDGVASGGAGIGAGATAHAPPLATPPPAANSIGWRVEARTMEVQLTDYENAAYTVFVALLSRAVLFFDLSFYIPMSLVDANMHTARGRSAARLGRFWFRRDVSALSEERGPDGEALGVASRFRKGGGAAERGAGLGRIPEAQSEDAEADASPATISSPGNTEGKAEFTPEGVASPAQSSSSSSSSPSPSTPDGVADGPWELFSMEEIMLGRGDPSDDPEAFPGLVPLLYAYLELIGADDDDEVFDTVDGYLRLIASRARGEVPTAAEYLRASVRSHPEYKGDSVLAPAVAEDLCAVCAAIAEPQEAGEDAEGPGSAPEDELPRSLGSDHPARGVSAEGTREQLRRLLGDECGRRAAEGRARGRAAAGLAAFRGLPRGGEGADR